jgi:hypothetical protein
MPNKATIVSLAGGVLVPAAVAVVFLFRGEICAMTWTGNDTLRCSSELTIKDKQATLDKHVIYATSKCRLTLVNVEFEAPTAIYLNSGAKITLKGGRIKGRSHAIYVGSGAELVVDKTTITGEKNGIYVGTGGRVVMTGGSVEGGNRAIYAGTDAEVTFKGTTVKGPIYAGTRARVKGAVITALKKSWHCRGKTHATLKGVRFTGRSVAVDARDECRLRIVGSHLKARRTALGLRGKARVTMEGGSLEGRYAVTARGGAVVDLKDVDVKGKLKRYGTAIIARDGKTPDGRTLSSKDLDAAAAKAQVNAKRFKRYKAGACDGIIDCYKDHGYSGSLNGNLAMTVGPDGRVDRVKLKARFAPRKVRACIRKLAKKHRIQSFEGPEGELICTWSGRLTGGTLMLSRGVDYKPAKRPKGKKGGADLALPDAE